MRPPLFNDLGQLLPTRWNLGRFPLCPNLCPALSGTSKGLGESAAVSGIVSWSAYHRLALFVPRPLGLLLQVRDITQLGLQPGRLVMSVHLASHPTWGRDRARPAQDRASSRSFAQVCCAKVSFLREKGFYCAKRERLCFKAVILARKQHNCAERTIRAAT